MVDEVKLGWKYADQFQTYMNGLASTGIGAMLLGAEKHRDIMTSYAANALKAARSGGPEAMAGRRRSRDKAPQATSERRLRPRLSRADHAHARHAPIFPRTMIRRPIR